MLLAALPILVELFTSEGCSSCPPADAALARLHEKQPVPGVQLLVLSEHVDYWNNLGWRDPFSDGQFTERQERYGPRMYTPQAMVDGRIDVLGSDEAGIERAAKAAAAETHGRVTCTVSDRKKISFLFPSPNSRRTGRPRCCSRWSRTASSATSSTARTRAAPSRTPPSSAR
ncbi:MAG: DUF1223 domain-containing protein [Myxococcales bacterium]